jgi:tetratricopeptide (TPR) repeat protein
MQSKSWGARAISLSLVLLMIGLPVWATCGGGGGGGMGGMGGGGTTQQTYPVPWKFVQPQDSPAAGGMVVYWFPTGTKEIENSSLRNSRILTLYSEQCVTMGIADAHLALGKKFVPDVPDEKLPVVVLANADGTVVSRLENTNGRLKVENVEKLVEGEFKKREDAVKQQMEDAKNKAKSGDSAGAVQLYRAVYDQRCLFPKRAKDAAKELKKLGATDIAEVPTPPSFEPTLNAAIQSVMMLGLAAENAADYREAERRYSRAHRMDPADPVPLRYLGELYRHHIGDWERARTTFEAILAMPADPISRAVALHGLGKMTIHDGEFKKGLALMERSVEEFPLALAYRNLAVYWNSEGDAQKSDFYVHKALALEPNDAFNLTFAAAFLAGEPGHADEALKIARENEALLPASYNLAAVFAQVGEKEKALQLLRRHFFEYERYQSVRAKEMMEARVDAVFASLRNDAAFMELTKEADGRLPMPMSPKTAGQ